MSTQQQFELELLGWVSKLDEGHIATLRQLAAGPPQEFMRQLAATGLSRGALHIAAATIDQHGFEGAAGLVQGRLQEVATHNQIEHAAQDPAWQDYAAKWLSANGITPEAGKSHVHQAGQILLAAQAQGVDPAALAQHIARTPSAADAEAQATAEAAAAAERAKADPAQAGTRLQQILGHPSLHRAAAAQGTTGAALLKKLVKLATSGDFVEAAEKSNGLFKDASEARELLGELGAAVAEDRLAQKASKRDGPSVPERTEPNEDDERRSDVLASLRRHRPPEPPIPVSESERAWRGNVAPGRRTSEVSDDRKFDIIRSARERSGESLAGIRTTPRVAAQVRRDEARTLREKVNAGESRRDDIKYVVDRAKAESKGSEALAQFDQVRKGALDLADQLEADAAEGEAAA
jgi:hypothetical protein